MQKNNLNLRICGVHLLNPYKTVVSHLNPNWKPTIVNKWLTLIRKMNV